MKRKQIVSVGAIIAALLVAQAAFAAPPDREEARIKSAVTIYMGKWVAGDYAAMRKMWDAKSQRLISEDQLTAAFRYTAPEKDGTIEALQTILGLKEVAAIQKTKQPEDYYHLLNGKPVVQGRPRYYQPGVIKMRGKDHATVDLQATFTLDSLTGLPDGCSKLIIVNQATKKEQTPNSGMASMALLFLSTTELEFDYDTALNEYSYTPITKSKTDAPLLLLRLSRYELVRENGQWKISNAIQSVKKYPEKLYYQTKAHRESKITLENEPEVKP